MIKKEEQLQELLKNTFVLSAAEMFLKLAKLILFVVIANVYAVETLGIFNYIVSFLLVFFIAGELGINAYVTTEQSKLKSFPDASVLAIGILKIFSVLVVLIFAFILYLTLGKSHELIFVIVSVLIFSDAILTLVYSFYRAVENFKHEFYYKTMQAFIYGLTSFLMYNWSEVGFVYFIALMALFNMTLAIYSLYRLTNFELYIKNGFVYIKENYINHFGYILPIFLSTIFTTLYFRVDILMLESMVGLESVGYYSVAYKLVEGAMIVPLMLGIVFLPKLSKNRKNVKQDLLLYLILGLVIFVTFYFTVESFIDILFSDNYIFSVEVAKILSYSIVIMSLNTYMFSYFIATKNAYINAKITFIMLILNLILNYQFIPMYGIEAAAYTTVTTEILGMLALIFYVRRHYAYS